MTRPTNNSSQSAFDSNGPARNKSSFNINISPFTGDAEQLEFFITQVTEVANCNHWSDIETLTFARSKLQGPALTYYIQKTEYHPISTTQELFAVLRAQYKKVNTCRAITDFNTLTMHTDESVRNFAHRLDSLAPKAHESVKDREALNSIKFNKFISVIPNGFRVHILQNNIKTYNEAVEKAILLEDCAASNEYICQASAQSTPIQELRSEINSLRETISQYGNDPNKNSSNSKQFHNRNKHKPYNHSFHNNHKFNKYKFNNQNNKFKRPIKKNYSAVPQQSHIRPTVQEQESLPNTTPIVCQFCGIPGHGCRFCPNFRLYFQPRQQYSNFNPSAALPSPNSASVQALIPHSATADTQNECSNALMSNLNPNAPPFQVSPNW